MNTARSLAPELSDRLQWINADPVRLGDCSRRAVIVAFFNQASPYCATQLDVLHHLALKHPQQLQVVGIHVPKYPFERDPVRVEDAVSRLGIRFPVASDPDYVAWQHFGVRGWPSLVFIDVEGQVALTLAGDVAADVVESSLAPLLQEAPVPLDAGPEAFWGRRRVGTGVMHHPAGIAVGRERMYIADAAHHRILECNLHGRVLARYGTGHAELVDGPAEECGFDSPHGLLLHRESLYIADTGNHALRRLDLASGQVQTLAGTGAPGVLDGHHHPDPLQTPLNRPWGLALDGERLYISLSGVHQVWALDLGSGALVHVAGSGQMGHRDGHAHQAQLAYPAGLAIVQNTLYIVDSGSASLRRLALNDEQVRTLIAGDVFAFGNEDGARENARLSLPLGLVRQPDQPVLWLADAGNDAVRTLRLGGGPVATAKLGASLRRPEALAASDGALWLVDTDTHRILRMGLDDGDVAEVEITDAGE